jgi:DNA-binding PadR family transcriptional regulator
VSYVVDFVKLFTTEDTEDTENPIQGLTLDSFWPNMACDDMSSEVSMESSPLTEPVLLILLSLAEQPRHGYSILKDVEQMSDGRVVLSTGTLYGALRRLLDDEWIERIEEEDTPRGRQAYRLTARGRKNLQLEVGRMKQLTRLANLRIVVKEA